MQHSFIKAKHVNTHEYKLTRFTNDCGNYKLN